MIPPFWSDNPHEWLLVFMSEGKYGNDLNDHDDRDNEDGDVDDYDNDDDDGDDNVEDVSHVEWQAPKVAVSLYVRGQFELIGGALVTDNNSFKKHLKRGNNYLN